MSNLSTNLKSWGAQGTEFPDGYNYIEGEQPVDDWDNYLTDNLIREINALQSVVNDRLETDSGASHPSSPEPGHLSHRTDSPGAGDGEQLYLYDSTDDSWTRLFSAEGDTMEGVINMSGYHIEDTSGEITLKGPVKADSARLDQEWFSKQEGGTVSTNSVVPIGTFNLDDGQTIEVTQAVLTKDGFTTPAPTGLDLVIKADGVAGTTTILSGDGTTLYDDVTGRPVSSYTNSTGSSQTVMIGIDNGNYGSGTGSETQAFAGYHARTV